MTDQSVRKTTIIISGRHRPHEEFMLAYGTIVGSLSIVGAIPYPTVLSQFDLAIKATWALLLAVSGVIGIAGCRLSGETALKLERAGLLMASGPLLIVAAFGFVASGYAFRALLGVAILGLFVAAHLTRAWHLHKELGKLSRKG